MGQALGVEVGTGTRATVSQIPEPVHVEPVLARVQSGHVAFHQHLRVNLGEVDASPQTPDGEDSHGPGYLCVAESGHRRPQQQ